MSIHTLKYIITINATEDMVFNYVSDWEQQSQWILFTNVQIDYVTKNNLGTSIIATTKVGTVKLVDTLLITEWEPPHRITIEHTGRRILGKGIFEVNKVSDTTSLFTWSEVTPVPFGIIGAMGLYLIKPILNIMFMRSLKKLKYNIELLNK